MDLCVRVWPVSKTWNPLSFYNHFTKMCARVHNPALSHTCTLSHSLPRHKMSILQFIWVKHKAPAPLHGLEERKQRQNERKRGDMRVNKQNAHRTHWSSPRDVTFIVGQWGQWERRGQNEREGDVYVLWRLDSNREVLSGLLEGKSLITLILIWKPIISKHV